MVLICDDTAVQPLLPQMIIGNEHILRVADMQILEILVGEIPGRAEVQYCAKSSEKLLCFFSAWPKLDKFQTPTADPRFVYSAGREPPSQVESEQLHAKRARSRQECPSSASSAGLLRNRAYVVTQASYYTSRAWYVGGSFTTPAHHPRGH